MTRISLWRLVERLYFEIEIALWACLAAFLIVFCTLLLPKMPAQVAKAQRELALGIAAENSAYCEKWGMKKGSPEHTRCCMDLQELRANIERRLADEMFF